VVFSDVALAFAVCSQSRMFVNSL